RITSNDLLTWDNRVHVDASWNGAITAACADSVLLIFWVGEFHRNGAPPAIGIRLRVIAHKIQMRKVFADGTEGVTLVLPALCKVRLAPRAGRHTCKNGRGSSVEFGFSRANHVDGDAFGLRQLIDVFRRNHAGIIRAIGKDDDDFPARILGGIL